jgi:hypothetical protein
VRVGVVDAHRIGDLEFAEAKDGDCSRNTRCR